MSNAMMIDDDFVKGLGLQPFFEYDQVVDFIEIDIQDTIQENTINEDTIHEIDNINTENLLDMLGD